MDLITIVAIVGSVLIGLVVLTMIIRKILIKKKISIRASIKKALKPKVIKTPPKPAEQPVAKEEEPPMFTLDKPAKSKAAVITDFTDFDEEDKALFAEAEPEAAKQEEKPREVKRKTFDEIMRNREASRTNTPAIENQFVEEDHDDDDFEQFRAEHSSYSKYMKDDSLIDRIKDLPPNMRAVIFNNIFNRIDDDK